MHNRSKTGDGGVERNIRVHSPAKIVAALYNIRMATIPTEIHGQRYISLATFRKSGVAVYTPIWFAEDDNKLYFMTNSKLGKCKRIRNNPQVKIAPCTIRGKITGPEFPATVRILRPEEFARVAPGDQRQILARPCPLPVAQHRHLHRDHARINSPA